jgi:hypothetical protein
MDNPIIRQHFLVQFPAFFFMLSLESKVKERPAYQKKGTNIYDTVPPQKLTEELLLPECSNRSVEDDLAHTY